MKQPATDSHNWTAIGDPTEAAIVVAAAKFGINDDRLREFPRLAELPFDSVRKRMTTIQGDGSAAFACIKGASEEILSRSTKLMNGGTEQPLTAADRSLFDETAKRLASRGLRVLAVATRPVRGALRSVMSIISMILRKI